VYHGKDSGIKYKDIKMIRKAIEKFMLLMALCIALTSCGKKKEAAAEPRPVLVQTVESGDGQNVTTRKPM